MIYMKYGIFDPRILTRFRLQLLKFFHFSKIYVKFNTKSQINSSI